MPTISSSPVEPLRNLAGHGVLLSSFITSGQWSVVRVFEIVLADERDGQQFFVGFVGKGLGELGAAGVIVLGVVDGLGFVFGHDAEAVLQREIALAGVFDRRRFAVGEETGRDLFAGKDLAQVLLAQFL